MSFDYSKFPSVESLLNSTMLIGWDSKIIRAVRVRIIQKALAEFKQAKIILNSNELELEIINRFEQILVPCMQKMINATGIILHTNLGRAPLGKESLNRMAYVLSGYSSLEMDEKGNRGNRISNIEFLICALTGAEAAVVVNNNALGVFLALRVLANKKEVIISRGELVQIGGGFRIPDVLESSGALLKEVGTTNMTSIEDYKNSVNPQTGLVLKVHPSCFYQSGHVQSTTIKELVSLATQNRFPLVYDLGSGSLGNSFSDEESVNEAVRLGVDVICFSGDKLLGSTQAGWIIGKSEAITKIAKDPLYRALRLGKTEIFLLEDTLLQLVKGEKSPTEILTQYSVADIYDRALRVIQRVERPELNLKTIEGVSRVGGGSTPDIELPTMLIECNAVNEEVLYRKLLQGQEKILVRKGRGNITLDLRTVFPDEETALVNKLRATLS